MPKIKIEGGNKLSGVIEVSGSKNSAVALIQPQSYVMKK